jgi:hypothetical protein
MLFIVFALTFFGVVIITHFVVQPKFTGLQYKNMFRNYTVGLFVMSLRLLFCCFIVSLLLSSSNKLVADQDGYVIAKEKLHRFKSEQGFPPLDMDYIAVVTDPKLKISSLERFELWKELIAMQNPVISKKNLKALFKTKYNSIRDLKCDYYVTRKNAIPEKDTAVGTTKYKYALKGDAFYVESERSEHPNPHHSIVSFSGSLYTKVFFALDGSSEVNIKDSLSSIQEAFEPMSPLLQAMIFDTKHFGFAQPWFDMPLKLEESLGLEIFEKFEIIDSRQYLVVSDTRCRILLDVEKDFSVFQQTAYVGKFTEKANDSFLVGVFLESQRTLFDLTDYGNGIWLPKKSETHYYSQTGETITMSDFAVYNEIKINSGLDEAFFVNVIPENALVSDSIHNMVYKQSDSPSINSLIKETVKSKRAFIFRYISIISGFALIFIVVAIKYRQYFKNKRERENRTEEIK